MTRLQSLISNIEQVTQLLDATLEQQRAMLTLQFSQKITVAYQKVSLAEKRMQVKNTRSHGGGANK
ncbi:hypothetical protein A0U40_01835 [[Bacillus] sp. KCTC 13219]|nr:hypothetical protein A0U40_01835 [[Bacillus] sp. KCTC 13219]